MSKWFFANLLLLLTSMYQVIIDSNLFTNPPVTFGFIGLLFFLFNWTRQAFFATIRNNPNRETKIKLAKLSKKIVPFHRWVGTTALVFIIIHTWLVIQRYGISFQCYKLDIGLIAGILLTAMVITGWLRLWRPSVRKRKWHIYIGMILFFVIFIHILL